MMNLLRGDLPRLSRSTSIVTASSASETKRSKPLKYAYEKEIVLYAHHKKLDYFSTECIYSPEAFRGSARTLIKDLEKIRPSSILDIVKSGEAMAALVPPEISGSAPCAGDGEDATTGCGAQNSDANSMTHMEKALAANEKAQDRETEVKLTNITVAPQPESKPQVIKIHDKRPKGRRKVVKQVMGQCERCGYLSSQKVCKACTLLEGLNKSRPRHSIEVGIEDEEGSTTLMRQAAELTISAG
jgi:cytoplasmic tRNA 2-thiolation protein 1